MNFLEIDRKQKDVVMKIEEEKTSKNKIDSKLDFENLSDGINYIGYMQKLQTQSINDDKLVHHFKVPQQKVKDFIEIREACQLF